MESLGGDGWECRPAAIGPRDYRLNKSRLAELEAAGLSFTILVDDLQGQIEAENARLRASRLEGGGAGGTWFSDYKDIAAINTYTNQLIAAYPNLASRVSWAHPCRVAKSTPSASPRRARPPTAPPSSFTVSSMPVSGSPA